MTEGWVDCPSLGPGWQRREVLRRNGTRSGHSDTYYKSPRGEKIRSRVELMKLLGSTRDMSDFDFKKGVFIEPGSKPPSPSPPSPAEGSHKRVRKSRRHLLPLEAATPPPQELPDLQVIEKPPDQELIEQKPLELELELPVEPSPSILTQQEELPAPVDQPAPKPRKRKYRKHLPPFPATGKMGEVTVEEANPEETIASCASCQSQFPGVMLPSQRRCRWLCPDCRAQRRDFNREQRYYKKKIPPKKDGCSSKKCTVEAPSTEDKLTPVRRRQKKPVTATDGPPPKAQQASKCRPKKLSTALPVSTEGSLPKAQLAPGRRRRKHVSTTKWKPSMERDPRGIPKVKCRKKQLGAVKERKKVGRPPKHPMVKLNNSVTVSTSRQNRKCGECEACLLKNDCGRCDFCSDKPKFGGRNLKRQKCRWRQCLQFAMVGVFCLFCCVIHNLV